jgi:hypothetical protein
MRSWNWSKYSSRNLPLSRMASIILLLKSIGFSIKKKYLYFSLLFEKYGGLHNKSSIIYVYSISGSEAAVGILTF